MPAFGQIHANSGISETSRYSGILSESALATLAAQDSTSDANSPATIPGKAPTSVYVPYTTGQKFKTATKGAFGPFAFVGSAISAGISQWDNSPYEWGQGASGYADRFASSFGVGISHQYFNFALDSMFHQDPRYFLSPDRSAKGRIKSVVKQIFVARQDSGGEAFAVGRWGSAVGAGLLSNAWQPSSKSSVGAGLRRASYIMATDVGLNLGKEFIPLLRRMNP